MLPVLACVLLLGSQLLPAQHRLLEAADLPGRALAAEELDALLQARADLPTTIALAVFAGRGLPVGSAARARLDAAAGRANATEDPQAALGSLRSALDELVETLSFRPLQQAELPAGFPGFVAVDEIELRQYPVYRMARTAMQGGSNGAFWPLFRHIESNGIAMTTPVQMDWQTRPGETAERPVRMAFLYGDPAIAPKTTDRGVEVLEMPAQTVLSIGAIGDDRRDRVEQMRARLDAFLAASGAAWVAAGPLRTMGYNSPMVPRDRRYFEVQLPVRRAAEAAPTAVR